MEDLDQPDLVLFHMMATMASNTNDLFNSHKMEKQGDQSMDPTVGVQDGIIRDFDKCYIGRI